MTPSDRPPVSGEPSTRAGKALHNAEMFDLTVAEDRRRLALAIEAEARATPPSLDVLEAFHSISRDMHNPSKRPCPTCDPITAFIGEPFGCGAFRLTSKEER